MTAVISEEETDVEESNRGGSPDTKEAANNLLEAGEGIKGLVTIFKLLSDETRLKILFILREADEVNVLELCRILGQRQPSVSHHLALLRVNGLIGMRRDGKHNFYHIRPSRLDEVIKTVLKVVLGRDRVDDATEMPVEFVRGEAKA
ncbi:MAG: metalloregulator ArsR/SmtB family transcription factor [Pirellulaceae bacterium]|jgi:ArsR family transcriptional regulator|nr:metalloregulator ArsR/SmtB family transcription factor [Pirellulaceae bacterium]MDP6555681.1 metalloregulator ArsR/SmtB family transcription factor [Pirellulaceae bacterium]MDP6717320.1 metalloregulator ArsR/SmtB family transcription factor [Pirellulaceae bacterium]